MKRMDTEIRLRELELQMRTLDTAASSSHTTAGRSPVSSLPSRALHRDASPSPPGASSLPPGFDVSKCVSLLRPFRETEVDGFFLAFEQIAVTLQWPREVWSLLLQCKLSGKALQVISALSLTDSASYECVKAAVLNAYELVPEAYCQRFQLDKPRPNQSYVEYAHLKSALFEKWCSASGVNSLADLKELILVEEFKRHVPERLALYLTEQKVSSLSSAALLADEFSLTHRFRESKPDSIQVVRPSVNLPGPEISPVLLLS
nr:uncharacterized protein LOC129160822 [Nothobranchius furzeri]XP_054593823.1 uncharacterized protein LOC129160822 [Nothobranchius furzeri]